MTLPAQDLVERLRDHAPKRICIEVDGYDPGPQFHTHWVLPGKNTERQVEYIRADFIEAQAAATISRLTADNEALRLTVDVERQKVQYRDKLLAKVEARADALAQEVERKNEALEHCRRLSGLDNKLASASVIITARMAEIHQRSDAALGDRP
jgi:hypothetical protein